MRIAFVEIGDPSDCLYWSGIPFAVLNELRRRGVDVRVIAPLSRQLKYLYSGQRILYRCLGKSFQPDRQPLMLRWYARQIERRLQGSGADVVFSMSSIPIARLNCAAPIIYWTDAVWAAMINYYESNSSLAPATERNGNRQEQCALERAAFAGYSSEWGVRSAIQHYRIDPQKIKLIPFGANVEVSDDAESMRSIIGHRERDVCRLLFLGVDWRRKGGPIALETVRLLNAAGVPARLTVAGCNPFHGGKPDFVDDIGFVSKATESGRRQITTLLKQSHFLFMPVRAECSAVAFCEACASALPIIATDTGGVTTYVRNGVNGLTLPLTAKPDEYAKEIQRLFADRSTYEELAFGAFREYETRFNWQSGVGQVLELAKQALGNRKQ